MSFSHASLLNVTNVSRNCQVQRTTVDSWISILEDLLIAYQISVFTQRAKRELSAHPKFYFFDAGVYRTLRPQSIEDSADEINGACLEGLVMQHLAAWKDYSSGTHTIQFWRTRSGVEVDFVVLGTLGFWAIEVKNGRTVRPDDLKSLAAFQEDYPEARTLPCFFTEERSEYSSTIFYACPAMSFSKNLAQICLSIMHLPRNHNKTMFKFFRVFPKAYSYIIYLISCIL